MSTQIRYYDILPRSRGYPGLPVSDYLNELKVMATEVGTNANADLDEDEEDFRMLRANEDRIMARRNVREIEYKARRMMIDRRINV